jgi:rubrerythrin
VTQLAEVTEQRERLDEFVRDANIKCYRRMMAGLLDEKHRKMIERLLKEEQAKLRIGSATMQRPGNHSREGIVP